MEVKPSGVERQIEATGRVTIDGAPVLHVVLLAAVVTVLAFVPFSIILDVAILNGNNGLRQNARFRRPSTCNPITVTPRLIFRLLPWNIQNRKKLITGLPGGIAIFQQATLTKQGNVTKKLLTLEDKCRKSW